MQKTILGLAFATALSATATASEDTSWLALDQEISNLSTVAVDNHGPAISGFISTYLDSNSDTDTLGWEFNAIRTNISGNVEDVSYKVSFDLRSGSADLRDAYVNIDLSDGLGVRIGQQKVPFLYGFSVSGGNQLFLDRTENAQIARRDRGVVLHGDLGDMGHFAAGMFNGADGTTDEHLLAARAKFDVMGDGAFGKHEGGVDFFGADGTHASVAVAYWDEEDAGGDSAIILEGAVAVANFWAHVDMVDLDNADVAPMGITGSYMMQEDVELAVRFEDRDDADDTSSLTVGANYYMALPHTVKWTLQYNDVSSDDAALESDSISLGLTVNF